MVILQQDDIVSLPNNTQAIYCFNKREWDYQPPSLWRYIKAIFCNPKQGTTRYQPLDVGDLCCLPDETMWCVSGDFVLHKVRG